MPRINQFQTLAQNENFDLSVPLAHAEVATLMRYWLPQIFFHPAERFHPIAIDDLFSMVESNYSQLPENARDEFKVDVFVRNAEQRGEKRTFDPPVVTTTDATLPLAGSANNSVFVSAKTVLGSGSNARAALDLEQIAENSGRQSNARVTHGASYRRSAHFFGATTSPSGAGGGTVGDPLLPRLGRPGLNPGDPDRPLIKVIATFKNLLDALDFELAYEQASLPDRDRLRGGFNILPLLFINKNRQGFPLGNTLRREIARELISLHRENSSLTPALDRLPFGWVLSGKVWDAVTRYAFAEYYFFFAYNDWDKHESSPFTNEHEGDDEGCCLVFDRTTINAAMAAGGEDALKNAVPFAIIASAHTEFQHADSFQHIRVPIPPVGNPDWMPRDEVEVKVYVAAGSHATYLTPGDHNVVDFDDVTGFIGENLGTTLIVLGIAALIPFGLTALAALAIILAAAEHFIDTEDHTSDEGIEAGPDEFTEATPFGVATELDFFPTSRDRHIYRDAEVTSLEGASFPGYWGGHNGAIDTSPSFIPKTGRYFRKLVDSN